jgi:pantoate--beta-alanine ligase
MKGLESIPSVREHCRQIRGQGDVLGFVPTMGALHEGHLNLVREAKRRSDHVVVSIFVNPTQFNDPEDLAKYPRDLEGDLSMLKRVGADAVFYPSADSLYPDGYNYKVTEADFSRRLCGAHRPGHFDGVLTVVMKLFQLVRPHFAFFGEKDHQQLSLIQGMVDSLFLDVQIVPVKTTRESDGLAMSSRNQRLSSANRKLAPLLYQVIRESASDEEAKNLLEKNGFRVDYVETVKGRRYAAAFLGEVRLIDNVQL